MRKTQLLFIFTLIAFNLSFGLSQAMFIPRDNTVLCSVTIYDAHYIENDIFAYVKVLLNTGSSTEKYYLSVTLEDPLGTESSITVKVYTHTDVTSFEFAFYNYATTSGNYKVVASVIFNSMCNWDSISDVVIFDPPGGNEGDPWIGVTVL